MAPHQGWEMEGGWEPFDIILGIRILLLTNPLSIPGITIMGDCRLANRLDHHPIARVPPNHPQGPLCHGLRSYIRRFRIDPLEGP